MLLCACWMTTSARFRFEILRDCRDNCKNLIEATFLPHARGNILWSLKCECNFFIFDTLPDLVNQHGPKVGQHALDYLVFV